MNAPALPKARMEIDEFLAWSERQPDGRYELVEGEIVAMSREDGFWAVGGSRLHRKRLSECLTGDAA